MILKKYIAELKRRNVFKSGIAYLIVAWLIAQIASTILPSFEAPPYVMKTLLFILGIGLPLILIFAWIYDITPEGIKKTESIEQKPDESVLKNNRLNKVIIASLSLIIALLLFNQFWDNPSNRKNKEENSNIIEPTTLVKKSIAVLPFKNFSGDPDMEAFCDGMTDEVISRLTKIKSIDKVSSRTSVFQYKETDKSMPQIASELGVSHILEGNFQKSGDKIKIKLQLIDGPSDNHFWSDDYIGDWNSDDIFKIQAEVAENVAKNMDVQITDIEFEAIRKIPTNNKEAYNLFLQANHQLRKRTDKIALANAKLLYEKAIALDSNFIDAYINLAEVWGTRGGVWGIYDEQQAWENQKTLLRKAHEIDSTNDQINNWLQFGSFIFDWDFDVYEKIYQTNSNLDQGFRLPYGYAIKTGRFDEALSNANKDVLDYPSSGYFYARKAEALFYLGKKDEVLELLETVDPLYSDEMNYLRETTKIYYYLGEYEKSRGQLKKLMTNFIDRPPIVMWFNAVYAQKDENKKDVAKYLGQLTNSYESGFSGSPAWFIALYYCHINDFEKAFLWLQRSYERHEAEMTWLREEPLLIPLREDVRYIDLYGKVGFPERT
ncbi:MAG: hypothetical protein ABJJ25_00855 [Eudoraea sp.]|uniref:hypothetical protein n=1 Tax=Eudoraea sp. TaxID=1979955 RepID=UPI003264184E